MAKKTAQPPSTSIDVSKKSSVLLRRIWLTYIWPHRVLLAVAFIFMLAEAGTVALQAKVMEPTINEIFLNKQASKLMLIGQIIFAIFVARGVVVWVHTVIMARMGNRIVANIQRDLFTNVLRQDLAFFQSHASGNLVSSLTNDVGAMRFATAETFTGLGKNLLTLIGLVVLMFYQNWQLSLLAFVVFPISAFMTVKVGKRLRQLSNFTQSNLGSLNALLIQSFQGIRQIKTFQAEQFEVAKVSGTIEGVLKILDKVSRVSLLTTPISELLTGVAVVSIVLFGGMQVVNGTATAGEFFSFIAAFFLAYEPMKKLSKLNATIQIGLGSAERVFALMDTQPQIVEAANAQTIESTMPSFEIEHMDFAYADGTVALSDINLHIPAGKRVALVGRSGSGKSTLLQLLMRFYDVSAGRILLAGLDLRQITFNSLRQSMALVSQDIFIFDDTVAKNIAYGQDNATQNQIEAAAKAAAAHEFVLAMPDGYGTRLGEMGVKLSGGQRQRIAIARAILKNAPILLLDEATSALDNESEQAVNMALHHLQQGKTTIVVAHRLTTIQDADLIVVMDQGRIVEQGTHTHLMAQGALYPQLYQALTLGILP